MDPSEPQALSENLEPATIDDLVADATSLGHKAGHRLVHDWVAKGLIDRPTRQRVGPTGSRKPLHSPAQRLLFCELLEMRDAGNTIQDLANSVIGLWIAVDHYIPTRQALRALRTWYGDPRSSKAEAHRISILQTDVLTDDPRLGTASERREFLRAVSDVYYTGRIDKDLLRKKGRPIFEPKDRYISVVHDRSVTAVADIDTFIHFLDITISAGRSVSEGLVTEEHLDRARILLRHHRDTTGGAVSMADLTCILGMFALNQDLLHRDPVPIDMTQLLDENGRERPVIYSIEPEDMGPTTEPQTE